MVRIFLDAFPRRPWKRPTRPTIWASTFLNLPRQLLCCLAKVLGVLWCLHRFAFLHIYCIILFICLQNLTDPKHANVCTFSIMVCFRVGRYTQGIQYPAKVCFVWLVFRRGSEIESVFCGCFILFLCMMTWGVVHTFVTRNHYLECVEYRNYDLSCHFTIQYSGWQFPRLSTTYYVTITLISLNGHLFCAD